MSAVSKLRVTDQGDDERDDDLNEQVSNWHPRLETRSSRVRQTLIMCPPHPQYHWNALYVRSDHEAPNINDKIEWGDRLDKRPNISEQEQR